MGKEVEMKYALTPAQYPAVEASLDRLSGERKTLEMETVYYDTPSGSLSARKWTLRRRMEGGIPVCTLKTPLDGIGRGEWECQKDSITQAIPELCKLGSPAELEVLAQEGLEAICGARFTRVFWQAEFSGSVIELALDRGTLMGGGREAPILELELELKSGSEDTLRTVAGSFAAEHGLREEPRSKFSRALRLARGD